MLVEKTTQMSQRTIERPSLHNQVVDQLREMIVHGELEPGTKIVETELSKFLGISRTPLREALKILALDGLVEILPHKGARVKPFSVEEIDYLFDVIAVLEGLAAEQAAKFITHKQMSDLEHLHETMRGHYLNRDRDSYFEINTEIHEALINGAANPILSELHSRLMLRARRGRYMAILEQERWEEAMTEHDELMAALRRKDSVSAGAVWRKHLIHTGNTVSKVLNAGLAGANSIEPNNLGAVAS